MFWSKWTLTVRQNIPCFGLSISLVCKVSCLSCHLSSHFSRIIFVRINCCGFLCEFYLCFTVSQWLLDCYGYTWNGDDVIQAHGDVSRLSTCLFRTMQITAQMCTVQHNVTRKDDILRGTLSVRLWRILFFAMWCRTYFSARTSGVSCHWSRRRLMTSTSNGERSWTSWTRWKTSTVERISQVREPISSVCNVCCHWMQFCCADIITRTQNVAPAH